nr:MAG TPA: hypothetical protein [Caudoviricetes sp.]
MSFMMVDLDTTRELRFIVFTQFGVYSLRHWTCYQLN